MGLAFNEDAPALPWEHQLSSEDRRSVRLAVLALVALTVVTVVVLMKLFGLDPRTTYF